MAIRRITPRHERAIDRLRKEGILGFGEAIKYEVVRNPRELLTRKGVAEIKNKVRKAKYVKKLAEIISQKAIIMEIMKDIKRINLEIKRDVKEINGHKYDSAYERVRKNKKSMKRLINSLEAEKSRLELMMKDIGENFSGNSRVSVYEYERTGRKINREIEREKEMEKYMARKRLNLEERQKFMRGERILRKILGENEIVFIRKGFSPEDIKVGGKIYDFFSELLIWKNRINVKDIDLKEFEKNVRNIIFEMKKRNYSEIDDIINKRNKIVREKVVKPEKKALLPKIIVPDRERIPVIEKFWRKKQGYEENVRVISKLIKEQAEGRMEKIRDIIEFEPVGIKQLKYTLIAYQEFEEIRKLVQNLVYRRERKKSMNKARGITKNYSELKKIITEEEGKIQERVRKIMETNPFEDIVGKNVDYNNYKYAFTEMKRITANWKK